MSITCFDNVSDELKKAVSEHGADIDDPHATLYEEYAPISAEEITSALAAGDTLAVAHAPAGAIFDGQIPALGHLAEPAALVAVSRRPVGHGQITSITLIPQAGPVCQQVVHDEQWPQVQPARHVPWATPADIAVALARHVNDVKTGAVGVADSNLIPPTGAKFAVVQVNQSWPAQFIQNFWAEANGASQTFLSSNSQTFYVYYANGNGAPSPYYVVLAIQSGTLQAAIGGQLSDYSQNERVFVLAGNLISIDTSQAPAGTSLLAYSPDSTRNSPVYDSTEIPMTVLAIQNGGLVSTPFTAERANSVPNEDWGVRKINTQGRGPNEAAFQYYNVTGWDASSTEPFSQWWQQMYDGSDNVIDLDAQCRTSANFDTVAAWRVPQNDGNKGPLPFQFIYGNSVSLAGFANPAGTGDGHHEMYDAATGYQTYLPGWDLVALTGAE